MSDDLTDLFDICTPTKGKTRSKGYKKRAVIGSDYLPHWDSGPLLLGFEASPDTPPLPWVAKWDGFNKLFDLDAQEEVSLTEAAIKMRPSGLYRGSFQIINIGDMRTANKLGIGVTIESVYFQSDYGGNIFYVNPLLFPPHIMGRSGFPLAQRFIREFDLRDPPRFMGFRVKVFCKTDSEQPNVIFNLDDME